MTTTDKVLVEIQAERMATSRRCRRIIEKHHAKGWLFRLLSGRSLRTAIASEWATFDAWRAEKQASLGRALVKGPTK